MPLQIISDKFEVTEGIKALVEDKLSNLLRRFKDTPEDLVDARVVLKGNPKKDIFMAKIEIFLGKLRFIGRDKQYSLESAVIGAVQDVEEQYERFKTKDNSGKWGIMRKMKIFKGGL